MFVSMSAGLRVSQSVLFSLWGGEGRRWKVTMDRWYAVCSGSETLSPALLFTKRLGAAVQMWEAEVQHAERWPESCSEVETSLAVSVYLCMFPFGEPQNHFQWHTAGLNECLVFSALCLIPLYQCHTLPCRHHMNVTAVLRKVHRSQWWRARKGGGVQCLAVNPQSALTRLEMKGPKIILLGCHRRTVFGSLKNLSAFQWISS